MQTKIELVASVPALAPTAEIFRKEFYLELGVYLTTALLKVNNFVGPAIDFSVYLGSGPATTTVSGPVVSNQIFQLCFAELNVVHATPCRIELSLDPGESASIELQLCLDKVG